MFPPSLSPSLPPSLPPSPTHQVPSLCHVLQEGRVEVRGTRWQFGGISESSQGSQGGREAWSAGGEEEGGWKYMYMYVHVVIETRQSKETMPKDKRRPASCGI